MPYYEYECPHEHRSQVSRPVDERDQTRVCIRCGHLMRRVRQATDFVMSERGIR